MEFQCTECAQAFVPTRNQKSCWYRSGRIYCSKECSKAYMRRVAAQTMAATNRKHASARMTQNNPMRDPEARAKMSATLKAIGHQPRERGGNGRGPTVPQAMLAEALDWPIEVVVRTGCSGREGLGYPAHYKLDIANEFLKVAVEVDGPSHGSLERRQQDAKKDAFLRGIGWTVLRFSNREVMEHLEECVQMVLSTTSKLSTPIHTLPMAS
jgi:hypothetical protein